MWLSQQDFSHNTACLVYFQFMRAFPITALNSQCLNAFSALFGIKRRRRRRRSAGVSELKLWRRHQKNDLKMRRDEKSLQSGEFSSREEPRISPILTWCVCVTLLIQTVLQWSGRGGWSVSAKGRMATYNNS